MSSPVAPRAAGRWFFGPVPDLLFGCGLAYAALFVWQVLDGPGLRAWLPVTLLPLLTLTVGAPHYGATLLRVYSTREDRRRYAIFTLWATLLLFGLYLVGLRVVAVGSMVITLYFTWSPWHYAGQNYGLSVLFLRRRGVTIAPVTKRLLYGTFILSYVLILLMLHTVGPVVQAAPATLEGTVYRFFSLGIPRGVRDVVAPVVLAAYVGCALGFAWQLRRVPLRDVLPTALLVGIQLLWFAAPAAATIFHVGWGIDPFNPSQRPYAFMWIAVGHFVQYLWITTYYAAASEGTGGRLRYLGKTLLAGSLLWTLPLLVFAPDLLGRLPYDLGLALLTGAVVNLHHFVLDGAIWKLRDGRVARALLRPPGEPLEDAAPVSPVGAWGRRGVWVAGLLAFLVGVGTLHQERVANRAAREGDIEGARAAIERAERLGRVTPNTHLRLARMALHRGDLDAARIELARAQRIHPTFHGWLIRAAIHEHSGDLLAASKAYDAALRLEPQRVAALAGSASVLFRLGEEERGLARLERAAELDPDHRRVRILLQSHRPARDGGGG